MMKKILVANRGEIAVRVLRTAKRLGIATVAVYSEADKRALHTQEADESLPIGPSMARHSYLNAEAVLQAAREAGVDAVHPGYGFLSENAAFARACTQAGITFIGPPPDVVELMAQKVNARKAAQAAGLEAIPGTDALGTVNDATEAAAKLGYPVLIKAAAGGGGIGMKPADDEAELVEHFESARQQAQRFFGDGTLYLEKYLLAPRHIEIQVAADDHGNVVHLGERDCSIQRRHQKVLEEAPATSLSASMRKRMTDAAVMLVRNVKYASVGTVELLLDGDDFYFLEMNTRLQVEHTVTEMVTDTDLVEWQLRIASGEALPLAQDQIQFSGHAIQCRIYAEDFENDFMPTPGMITHMVLPMGDGIRNDTGFRSGDTVTPFYDPMVAKLIVHGPDRPTAIERTREALSRYVIEGLTTNLALHHHILDNAAFRAGDFSTRFLSQELDLG